VDRNNSSAADGVNVWPECGPHFTYRVNIALFLCFGFGLVCYGRFFLGGQAVSNNSRRQCHWLQWINIVSSTNEKGLKGAMSVKAAASWQMACKFSEGPASNTVVVWECFTSGGQELKLEVLVGLASNNKYTYPSEALEEAIRGITHPLDQE
jgi:hypothetical protein